MSDTPTDSEYEYDYTSEEESEYETENEESEAESEVTYTSLEAALTSMADRMAELDADLDTFATKTTQMEQPLVSVALASFTNPRVLEAAPFRQTKFRLKPAAKTLLKTPHHTVTFAELCAAIRNTTSAKKEELERMLGSSAPMDFLGILGHLDKLIE